MTPSFAKKEPYWTLHKGRLAGCQRLVSTNRQEGRLVMALCEEEQEEKEEAATADGAGPIHLTLRNHAIVFALPNDGEGERVRRPPSSLSLSPLPSTYLPN